MPVLPPGAEVRSRLVPLTAYRSLLKGGSMTRAIAAITSGWLVLGTAGATAQRPPAQAAGDVRYAPRENYAAGAEGSRNLRIQFHLPLTSATDIRLDQELSRPYVYQPHGGPAGFHVIDVKDPGRASIIYSWSIDQPDLHVGRATGVMLFKQRGRYYGVLSTQFGQQGPDNEVVAI